MKKNKLSIKVVYLLCVSIILVTCLFLGYQDWQKRVVSTLDETSIETKEVNQNETITNSNEESSTTSPEEKKDDTSSSTDAPKSDSTSPSNNNSNTNNTPSNNNSSSSNSSDSSSAPSSSNSTPSTPAPETMASKNQALINQIYQTYGYHVSYGQGEYCYGASYCNPLTDENIANQKLTSILATSAKFPAGFFRTFQGTTGYRIELMGDILGTEVSGLASYEMPGDNVLYINASIDGFDNRLMYHETWHMMEDYINYRGYDFDSDWSSLNPPGYSYGDTDDGTYVVDLRNQSNLNVYFMSYYGETNSHEDRAEIFTDLMFRPYKYFYMVSNCPLNTKAKKMVTVLRSYFGGATSSSWERWISW